MNCTCISEMCKILTDQAEAKGADDPIVVPAFVSDDYATRRIQINMPFRLHANNWPHNKLRGTVITQPARFCPFCGASTAKPAAEAA
jgi:hypothetical protein